MEITLKNSGGEKEVVDILPGTVTSIQSSGVKKVLSNIRKDYSTSYIDNSVTYFVGNDVSNEIELYTGSIEYSFISDIMKIFDLNETFFHREVRSLSFTERIYLNIIRNLSSAKNLIIFDDVFKFLDYKNQKMMIKLLEYLKQKKYYIIITSSDVNINYKIADYSIVWNKSIFKFDSCDIIYTDVSTLIDNKISVPILPLLTYKAKTEKGIKLFYSKDVRDVIKDIYKHV